MKTKKPSQLKRAIRHLKPSHIMRTFLTRRIVEQIANKYGLVYFGRVNHNEDEYKMVRGHTTSPAQIDNHYCVGTLQGYDTTFVHRNNLCLTLDKKERRCHWLIVAVQLKSKVNLPRVYVCPQGMEDIFEAAYTGLKKLQLGHTTTYSQKFLSNFNVYGKPSDMVSIERLLPPSVALTITDHFATMPLELEDNVLYIYNENQHPTGTVVEKMLENAIWLATNIDVIANTD